MTVLYSKQYLKLFKVFGIFAEVFGANVVKDDYRMTWITWSVIHIINVAIAFSLYTVYTVIADGNNLTDILKLLCMFCSGIQGYVKIVSAIVYKNNYRFLHLEVVEIYQIYERKCNQYQKYLKNSILLQKHIVLIILGIYTILPMGLIATPIYQLLYRNEREFIMHFFVPLMDTKTDFGYYTTMTIHITCVMFGCYGNFVSDYMCFHIIAHVPLIKNILKSKFNDLDEILQNHEKDSMESAHLLREIFRWHQKYITFIKTSETTFFYIIFVQIFTAFIGICSTVVCLFLGTWIAAPIFLIYSFVLLYIFCGLGNLVEVANDDTVIIIYDSLWNNLTPPEQKMIQIMLRESQKQEGLTIANISPLSLNTALQLTKTIYSVAMMFNNFLN